MFAARRPTWPAQPAAPSKRPAPLLRKLCLPSVRPPSPSVRNSPQLAPRNRECSRALKRCTRVLNHVVFGSAPLRPGFVRATDTGGKRQLCCFNYGSFRPLCLFSRSAQAGQALRRGPGWPTRWALAGEGASIRPGRLCRKFRGSCVPIITFEQSGAGHVGRRACVSRRNDIACSVL